MDRRKFLKTIALSGAALAGMPLLSQSFIPFAEAADIPTFSFAHITDLHLDVKGKSSWMHREKSIPLFIDALRQVGRLQKLTFVIFGGDQVQAGPNDSDSLYVFREWSKNLSMPYYVLLGDMEVSPVAGESRLTRDDYLTAWKKHGLGPDRSSWTFDPVRGVRVIGFDVTVAGRPYGEAGPAALNWLERQLHAARGHRLVIVATHQLLLPTSPQDETPAWSLWMVRNHARVREVLAQHQNVRLVLSGHHHASKVETEGRITYASDPAIVTYPCAFRLFTVSSAGISLRNIGLDDQAAVAKARELLAADPYALLYDPAEPRKVLDYSVGLTERDRESLLPW